MAAPFAVMILLAVPVCFLSTLAQQGLPAALGVSALVLLGNAHYFLLARWAGVKICEDRVVITQYLIRRSVSREGLEAVTMPQVGRRIHPTLNRAGRPHPIWPDYLGRPTHRLQGLAGAAAHCGKCDSERRTLADLATALRVPITA
jgi:hypothetical protein